MDTVDRYTQLRISAVLCIFFGLVSYAFAAPAQAQFYPDSSRMRAQARTQNPNRVSMRLQNRPLQEAFGRISQVLRKNLIVDTALRSTTTLSFQDVDVMAALRAIAKTYDLGYHLTPSHLIIVPQKSPRGFEGMPIINTSKQNQARTIPVKPDLKPIESTLENKIAKVESRDSRFENLARDLDAFMPQASSRKALKKLPVPRELNESKEELEVSESEQEQLVQEPESKDEEGPKTLASMTRISGITGAQGSRIAIVDFRGHSVVWKKGFKVDGIYEIQEIQESNLTAKNLQTGDTETLHF